jgi:preprotein translocase subunit YajC
MAGFAFAAPAGGAGGAGGFASFIPLILIFVVFYFLLIRPQQKQAKQHQQFLAELKKGTRVVTKGGIHGVITDLNDNILSLEIAKDVTIKIARDGIAGAINKDGTSVAAAGKESKEVKKSGG